MVKSLERKIIGKMNAIKRGDIQIKESNIGVLFNQMKNLDEPLYLKLVKDYKDIIQKI